MKIFVRSSYLLLIILLSNCVNYKIDKSKTELERKFYSSNGFALIYNDDLFKQGIINKKITNEKIMVMHSTMRTNTNVSISNPVTSKEIITKISKRANYPKIFNIVISERLAEALELDLNNPYVEILEIKKNKKFIAKKGVTHDEEKNVAIKAPVEKIEIANLSEKKIAKKKKNSDINFFLIISDFYYKESAVNLKKELNTKIKLSKLSIKKINDKKYRLYVGPFKNFNSLKLAYIGLNKIGFDDLNIIMK